MKQTCSSPQELFNGVLHSTCAHRGRVDSWLLVVGNQTASLTPSPFFDHNFDFRCLNGSCEAIFDIYISRTFQHYKEHLEARCFDPYNRALKFWESRRTPSSHFWECESHPHTCLKVGCDKMDDWLPKGLTPFNTSPNCKLHKLVVNLGQLSSICFHVFESTMHLTNLS